jgi:hypothetical protein
LLVLPDLLLTALVTGAGAAAVFDVPFLTGPPIGAAELALVALALAPPS